MEQNIIINTDNIGYIKTMSDNVINLVLTDPYFETMGIGNSKATKQDVKSNFVSVTNELYRVMKDDSNLVFF